MSETITYKKDLTESDICPHCGAAMKEWQQRLTPGIIDALRKICLWAIENKTTTIHIPTIFPDRSSGNNSYKLQYFAMMKATPDHRSGYFEIQEKAFDFISGRIPCHVWVKTFRNNVVEYSKEKIFVKEVKRLWKKYPQEYWQREFPYEIRNSRISLFEEAQTTLPI